MSVTCTLAPEIKAPTPAPALPAGPPTTIASLIDFSLAQEAAFQSAEAKRIQAVTAVDVCNKANAGLRKTIK